jgi:Ca-activated chloride channel family protein
VLKDNYAPTLATVRMRYEKPGADSAATERVTTFPTSALRSSATSASRDTRLAYSAATFAEVLRGSPHAQEVKIDRLITFAREAARPGETDDAELIALMKKAADLGANGGNAMISAR